MQTSNSGIVDAEKSFVFEDEVYRISLVNKDLGPHKAVLALLDEKGTVLSESKISWTRLPYLSSIPETIFLGNSPCRAFLRCPDETIEFTQVKKSPQGVNAFLGGPKMITVVPQADSPAIIDDFIEVETNSPEHPVMRVPLRRFASSSRNSD